MVEQFLLECPHTWQRRHWVLVVVPSQFPADSYIKDNTDFVGHARTMSGGGLLFVLFLDAGDKALSLASPSASESSPSEHRGEYLFLVGIVEGDLREVVHSTLLIGVGTLIVPVASTRGRSGSFTSNSVMFCGRTVPALVFFLVFIVFIDSTAAIFLLGDLLLVEATVAGIGKAFCVLRFDMVSDGGKAQALTLLVCLLGHFGELVTSKECDWFK
ncbi:hypothetical protein ABEB36_000432 [Hypothenemus hampei]|uniref:Uncharacterized protein n=1 Tax=Hypothenemus hampei TaxID=57062 RepID=A0ABD1FB61_HYPHA